MKFSLVFWGEGKVPLPFESFATKYIYGGRTIHLDLQFRVETNQSILANSGESLVDENIYTH